MKFDFSALSAISAVNGCRVRVRPEVELQKVLELGSRLARLAARQF